MERCPWSEICDIYRENHGHKCDAPIHEDRALLQFIIQYGA